MGMEHIDIEGTRKRLAELSARLVKQVQPTPEQLKELQRTIENCRWAIKAEQARNRRPKESRITPL